MIGVVPEGPCHGSAATRVGTINVESDISTASDYRHKMPRGIRYLRGRCQNLRRRITDEERQFVVVFNIETVVPRKTAIALGQNVGKVA